MNALVILKYIPSPVSDRKGDVTWSVLRGHKAAGVSVTVMTPGRREPHDWPEVDVSASAGERIAEVADRVRNRILGNGTKGDPARRRIVRKVRQWLENNPVDIILAEGTSRQTGLLAHAISQATGTPFVIRERLIYERVASTASDIPADYLSALRAAAAVACVSPQLADVMRGLGVRDDLDWIPNSISDEFFAPPAVEVGSLAHRIRAWAAGDFVFGSWTRWREFKRLDLLLEAFAEVRARRPGVRLLVAGEMEPPMDEEWTGRALDRHGIAGSVWLHGAAARPEIHQVAHSVDCCVVPSDYETFSLPALEAMAAGKPVVATACNGPESLVTSERLGRIVPRGEAGRLAEAMADVAGSAEDFDPVWIRERTYERFSTVAVGRKYRNLYERVLSVEVGRTRT